MRRKLFTLAAAGSAVLFVAVCVLWVRSYWRYDLVGAGYASQAGARNVAVGSYLGRVLWARGLSPAGSDRGFGVERDAGDVDAAGPRNVWEYILGGATWWVGGFGYMTDPSGSARIAVLVTPTWAVALVAGLLPAARIAGAVRAWRRKRLGLCSTCGYDLRVTPGRCPECGAVPGTKGTPG